jgi:hypothetical protein
MKPKKTRDWKQKRDAGEIPHIRPGQAHEAGTRIRKERKLKPTEETMKKAKIGEKLCALILSEQLGCSMQSAWKEYVKDCPIDPSWQAAAECLMRSRVAELRKFDSEQENPPLQ